MTNRGVTCYHSTVGEYAKPPKLTFTSTTMALPVRKAGGLYGGVQFSSSSTVLPSTAQEPAPESDIQESNAAVASTSLVSTSTTIAIGEANNAGRSQDHASEAGATAPAGKPTAGIHIC